MKLVIIIWISLFSVFSDAFAVSEQEKSLVQQIKYHDHLYWSKNKPEISDAEYDSLKRQLAELHPEHSLLRKVHSVLNSDAGKVYHERPMLSLQKAYSFSDIDKWAKKYVRSADETLLIQPKYDGSAVDYSNGILSTRGGGEFGVNISHLFPYITILSRIDNAKGIRGELIITGSEFDKLCENMKSAGLKPYANQRSAIAAVANTKVINHKLMKGVSLSLIEYSFDSLSVPFSSLEKQLKKYKSNIKKRNYPTDGIVVKLADSKYAESLGSTNHHPRSAIAFKFQNKSAETTLLDVVWKCGKTKLTPTAVFEKVSIGGVNITKASLHSANYIRKNDVHIGDKLLIERAGDAIPHIKSIKRGAKRKSALIRKCPDCRKAVVESGVNICCINEKCKGTIAARLISEAKLLKIKGLGPSTIKKIVESFDVENIIDLKNIEVGQIESLRGFGEKSSMKLYLNIQAYFTSAGI